MRFCAETAGDPADLLRFEDEIASHSCSSQVRRKGNARPHNGPAKPAVSLLSQCLPPAGVPAADLTPCVST